MKRIKICLMCLLALMSVSTVDASTSALNVTAPQNEVGLEGNWVAKVKSLTENMNINIARHIDGCDMNVTFEDSRMAVRCNIYGSAMFQGMSISVGIRAVFGADYTVEGDSLFFAYGDNELDVDVYSVHVNADDNVRAAMDAMGVSESSIRDMLTDRLQPESFRTLIGYIGDSVRYELPDKKTLILTDSEGHQIQFSRKKAKKKKE